MTVKEIITELQKLPPNTLMIDIGIFGSMRVLGVGTCVVYATEAGDMNGGTHGPISDRPFPHQRARPYNAAYLTTRSCSQKAK